MGIDEMNAEADKQKRIADFRKFAAKKEIGDIFVWGKIKVRKIGESEFFLSGYLGKDRDRAFADFDSFSARCREAGFTFKNQYGLSFDGIMQRAG